MTDFRGSINALLISGKLLEFSPGRISTVHTTCVAPEVIKVYNFQEEKTSDEELQERLRICIF
jgi:hypothetical protein